MIIDSHAHLGYDCAWDWLTTEEELISGYEKYGVDGAIVQPSIGRPYIEDTAETHNQIYRLCQNYPGRFWGMANINPHFRHEEYQKEAERCINELGFVGIKLNPQAHGVHPATEDGLFVFECAKRLCVPVMIHTSVDGMSWSDPVSLFPAIEKYSEVKIILAHAGSDALIQQAIYLGRKYNNVYLEPSWINILNFRTIIKELGVEKVMFSTDEITNTPIELVKYRTIIKDKDELEKAFSGTAIKVFNLKINKKE